MLKEREYKYFDEEKKKKLSKQFNPEKYQMTRCPSCVGTGKLSNRDEGVKVCSQCGGFGWIIRKTSQDRCPSTPSTDQ